MTATSEPSTPETIIPVQPLTHAAFAPFGDVVTAQGAALVSINQGFAERCNALADIDVTSSGGEINISLLTAEPRPRPITIDMMERHPLGSQLFFPLQDRPWLVVVCANPHDIAGFRAFSVTGRQGVNYARNTWHYPLLVHDPQSRFFVVDRKGPGDNLEEVWLEHRWSLGAATGGTIK
jgi:ureidoglycolate lyase